MQNITADESNKSDLTCIQAFCSPPAPEMWLEEARELSDKSTQNVAGS